MSESRGRVTVAQNVLDTIVQLTALSVPGVSRMGTRSGSRHGTRVQVHDQQVVVDVHVIVAPDANMREVGRAIQIEVARAVRDMVGMEVAAVDVHIQDVEAAARS